MDTSPFSWPLTEPPARTRARMACWRLHRSKVGWRLADLMADGLTEFVAVDDGEFVEPEVALAELRAWEVDSGRRAGTPSEIWFDRRVDRLTRGVRPSPKPATSSPAGSSPPQAQGGN